MSADAPARVLFLSPSRIASVQILEGAFHALEDAGAISFRELFDDASEPAERAAAIREADVAFFFRAFDPPALALLRACRARGVPSIYSLDDDFARLPPDSPLGRLYLAPENAAAQRELVAEADAVWVFTAAMADRYRAASRRIVVGRLPSPLERIAGLAPDAEATAEDAPGESGTLTIGYAGRFVHERDLAVAVRPLRRLLEAPGSRIELELVDCFPTALRGHPRVRFVPYREDLDDYYRHLARARWSIGLALLEDGPFERGKTDVKYRDYAAFGIPGIYSDMPVYAASVRDGVTGLLVAHTEDAVAAALDRLVASPELRRSIRTAARRDVAERYALDGIVAQLADELSALLAASGATARVARPAAPLRARSAVRMPPRTTSPGEAEIVEPPDGQPESAVRLTGVLRYVHVARHHGWSGIDVLLGTHGRRVAGTLLLRVVGRDGRLLRRAEADLGDARDNAWLTFRFRPLERSAGERFALELALGPDARGARVSLYESAPRRSRARRALDRAGQHLPFLRPRAGLHARARHRAAPRARVDRA